MNSISVFLFATFLFGLYLTNRVWRFDSNSKLYRLSILATSSATALAFWEYEISKVKDIEMVAYYAELHIVFVLVTLYLCVLVSWFFMHVATKNKIDFLDVIFLTSLSSASFLMFYEVVFNGKTIFDSVFLDNGFWKYRLSKELDLLMISFRSFCLICLFAMNYSVWTLCRKSTNKQAVKWSNMLIGITFFGSILIVYLFSYNGDMQQNGYYLMSPFLLFCIAVLAWPFSNYKIYELSPVSAMNNIMDIVSNLVIIHDDSLNVKYMNRVAKVEFGLSGKNIEGISVLDLAKICNFKETEQTIALAKELAPNEKYESNFSVVLDGVESFYNLTISPIFDAKDIKQGYISIGTNITSIKAAELRLKENNVKLLTSNIELERFAFVASHDLKTPIRNVVSFVGLMERKLEKYNDKEILDYLAIVKNSASQMYYLVQDVLEYSQLKNPNDRAPKQVDLNEVINKAWQALHILVQEKKCIISCDELPVVYGDPVRMGQLFQNLIENGIKYNDSTQPTITISYKLEDSFHVFYVMDNGIGIDPKYQSSIFDIFKRLHTSNEYEGTGIGLAICTKIANSYGGHINVTSEEGKGSVFEVRIKLEEV